MTNAHILTIGTEITNGEVVNSNAAWVSEQLERLGVRVHSHLTVRDQREDMLAAFRWPTQYSPASSAIVVVTGGLGPTSDDMTRALVAEHLGVPLEFDDSVWSALNEMYKKRGLPIREAHKHQCWFPKGSVRLANPTGTALGFYAQDSKKTHYFVLPGPPRELEGMFNQEVLPRLKPIVPPTDLSWHRWSVFAVPESEVAELVEPLIAGTDLEVGYRAQVPYVRVKLFAHPEKHKTILDKISKALEPSKVIADLAEELLKKWPDSVLNVHDELSDGLLAQRLFATRRKLLAQGLSSVPEIRIGERGLALKSAPPASQPEQFVWALESSKARLTETRSLQFKLAVDSERGRRSLAEWALWLAVRAF